MTPPRPGDAEATVAGERLRLLPERAAFWERGRTLFIADPHIGKVATLRAAGAPLPGGSTSADLARLSGALDATGAARLVVLGDLFHARAGRVAPPTLAALTRWRARHPPLEVLVVRGNHDRHAGDPPLELGFQIVDEPHPLGPFSLRHFPDEGGGEVAAEGGGYPLAGHLHPGVVLAGGGEALRIPCFWFAEGVGVLPAFGGTTGLAVVRPGKRDQVFVIAEGEVLEV